MCFVDLSTFFTFQIFPGVLGFVHLVGIKLLIGILGISDYIILHRVIYKLVSDYY